MQFLKRRRSIHPGARSRTFEPDLDALTRRELLRAGGGLGALALAHATALAGCRSCHAGGSRGGSRGQDESLLCAWPFDLQAVINPLLPRGGRYPFLLFSRLWGFDAQMAPVPELALRHEVSADGREYTVHLRRDATWHDGRPVTAHDVVFTVEARLRQNLSTAVLRFGGEDVRARALDPHTVRFVLPAPNVAFVAGLAWDVPIAPRHLLDGRDPRTAPYNQRPVGSGPFRFHELVAGDHLTVVRNPSYYAGAPALAEIVIRPIPDLQARLAAFQAGEIDLDLREEDLVSTRQFGETPGARAYVLEMPYVQQLVLNHADPLFADVRVRKAIAHALDRAAMVRAVIGDARYAARSIVGPRHWAYNPNVPGYGYDPARARALLEEAGWRAGSDGVRVRDGARFRFVLQPYRDWERRYAPMIQQYLRAVGVETTIEVVPDQPSARDLQTSGRAQSLFAGCIDYEPHELYTYFHSQMAPPRGLNIWHYRNPAVDALLERGHVEPDRARRAAIYGEVQSLVLADCATIPLHVHLNNEIVREDRVTGFPAPAPNWHGILFQEPWKIRKSS